jgi:hypothetical protein
MLREWVGGGRGARNQGGDPNIGSLSRGVTSRMRGYKVGIKLEGEGDRRPVG